MNTKFGRKKSKNPPYFSHEFIISNHGDIVSLVSMVIVMGLLYKGTHKISSSFLFIQYNNTEEYQENDSALLYSPGMLDLCVIFFYTLICIVCHAVIQEYLLDKTNRKLNLTKIRLAKFNESAHLAWFYALSTFWALYSVLNEGYITSLSSLWEGYPQRWMPFWIKLFFITQICYWLHDYPELYFQRVKKELIATRILHATIYLMGVSMAYVGGLPKLCIVLLILHYMTDFFLHVARVLHLAEYTKFANIGFTIWNTVFIPVRMACIILAFLTLHYGLGKQGVAIVDLTTGNYNTFSIRIASLSFVFITQALMVWNFITFHQRHRRDKSSSNKGYFFSSHDSSSQKKKEKKRAKREDEDPNDMVDSDQNNQKEGRRRKLIKTRPQ